MCPSMSFCLCLSACLKSVLSLSVFLLVASMSEFYCLCLYWLSSCLSMYVYLYGHVCLSVSVHPDYSYLSIWQICPSVYLPDLVCCRENSWRRPVQNPSCILLHSSNTKILKVWWESDRDRVREREGERERERKKERGE